MINIKIVHICLAGPFSDDYTYQENLLTKYHSKSGNDVSVITSNWALDRGGKMSLQSKDYYINSDDVEIYRIKRVKQLLMDKITIHEDYEKLLFKINPDIIFIHGCQFVDISPIINYYNSKSSTKIYVDNHADFSNSARSFFSKNILHKLIWRYYAFKLEPIVEKFYGVLPSRVDFLNKIYKIPLNKIELLNMGGDDEYIKKITIEKIEEFKESLKIPPNKKILVTAGKIDQAKKEVLLLMEYANKRKDIYLIIFGSVSKELIPYFNKLLKKNIIYLGWQNTEESYLTFAIADLVVFPGRHSVYWEQVVSQKIPMVVKYWEGTTHIDIGGNVKFVNYNKDEKYKLFSVLNNTLQQNELEKMRQIACSDSSQNFLYSKISEHSIMRD